MSAIKFSKQYVSPNPDEIDYWIDLSANQYGGKWKYFNGISWIDLINPDGTSIDANDYYTKLQINQMLSNKASVESVESKVDDSEIAEVIKNIEFKDRGTDGIEMVVFKFNGTNVGITLPVASNATSGIITKETFKKLVNTTQLQELYTEMYDKLSKVYSGYQKKLKAGDNIVITDNNVIHATSKIGIDWDSITGKPDLYDKGQVDTMMSGVYKIKGSRTFEELPTEGNNIGDTYNITNSFTLNGEEYELGTNVVWTEEGWDALAGIFDTSELEEDIQEVKDNYLPLSGGNLTGSISMLKGSSINSTDHHGQNTILAEVYADNQGTGTDGLDCVLIGSANNNTVVRSSSDNLYHYNNDKGDKYKILD